MDRTETLKILAVLKGAYPYFYRDMKRQEADAVVSLWAELFSDEPYELVAASVKVLIACDEKGYPPHPGAVKSRIRQLTQPRGVTEGEAWAMVHDAIKKSGYNSRDEFEKLPPTIRRLVGGPSQLKDWSQMDCDTVQSVVASNFQRSYRAAEKSEREYAMLPEDVKKLALSFSKTMSFPETPEPKTLYQLRQELEAHDG